MDSSVSAKDEIWFLRVCHHVSNAVYVVMKWKGVERRGRARGPTWLGVIPKFNSKAWELLKCKQLFSAEIHICNSLVREFYNTLDWNVPSDASVNRGPLSLLLFMLRVTWHKRVGIYLRNFNLTFSTSVKHVYLLNDFLSGVIY